MKDPFGVRAWRQKPLRERLLPWPFYFVVSVDSVIALGRYALTGPDESNPVPVAVLFLLMAPPFAYLAVVFRRLRR